MPSLLKRKVPFCGGVTRVAERGWLSASESLERTELLSAAEDLALLRTGEASGQLDAMLERLANLHGCRLAGVYDLIADWTPRLAYALVALIIVNGLVT